jgi:hypothetical protein
VHTVITTNGGFQGYNDAFRQVDPKVSVICWIAATSAFAVMADSLTPLTWLGTGAFYVSDRTFYECAAAQPELPLAVAHRWRPTALLLACAGKWLVGQVCNPHPS